MVTISTVIIILSIIIVMILYKKSKKRHSIMHLPQLNSTFNRPAIPFVDEYNMIPTDYWMRVRNIYMN
ncbi:MAG: hypothetical protein ACFE9Z_07245 [Promethearchaeota archaeon]